MENKAAIEEVCSVEGSDELHDYGGGHGNKGNDFARFWLIDELIKLSQAGTSDYLFILEYVQDVARLNVTVEPFDITFYQVKKREGTHWDLNSLAGLTKTGTQVKPDSALAKLFKAVFSFKAFLTSAEFISNTRYKIELASGEMSVSMDSLSLVELTPTRRAQIGKSAATAHAVSPSNVPLERVRLRYVPIEVNDMRAHVIGTAHGFLKALTPEHAAQADSFVDALFAKLATASRNTSKCKSWDELIAKRGYSKDQFDGALGALQVLPDQQKRRTLLLENLAQVLSWHPRHVMKVEVALTELLRIKLVGSARLVATETRAAAAEVHHQAATEQWPAHKEFVEVEKQLIAKAPEESSPTIQALAIYLMVEAWTNQTFA
jgi:hypothetical protein